MLLSDDQSREKHSTVKMITITITVPDEAEVKIDSDTDPVQAKAGGPLEERAQQVNELIRADRYQEARAELDLLKQDGYLLDPTGAEDDFLSTVELNEGELAALQALIEANLSGQGGLAHEQLKALFADHEHPGKKVGNVMSSLVRRFTAAGYQPIVHKDRFGTWHITDSAATNIGGSMFLEEQEGVRVENENE